MGARDGESPRKILVNRCHSWLLSEGSNEFKYTDIKGKSARFYSAGQIVSQLRAKHDLLFPNKKTPEVFTNLWRLIDQKETKGDEWVTRPRAFTVLPCHPLIWLIYGLIISNPSNTSPAKPLAEPSQYIEKVQVVVLPNEPAAQMKMSAPSPLTPVTLNAPRVVR